MVNRYLPFLNNDYFDAFTWVPTIQGNLYTSVLDRDNIDGQIDKHLVNFKYGGDDLQREISHHLAATFLIADFDRKLWPNPYSGVFRWILRGSINSQADCKEYLDHFRREVTSANINDSDLTDLSVNFKIATFFWTLL